MNMTSGSAAWGASEAAIKNAGVDPKLVCRSSHYWIVKKHFVDDKKTTFVNTAWIIQSSPTWKSQASVTEGSIKIQSIAT